MLKIDNWQYKKKLAYIERQCCHCELMRFLLIFLSAIIFKIRFVCFLLLLAIYPACSFYIVYSTKIPSHRCYIITRAQMGRCLCNLGLDPRLGTGIRIALAAKVQIRGINDMKRIESNIGLDWDRRWSHSRTLHLYAAASSLNRRFPHKQLLSTKLSTKCVSRVWIVYSWRSWKIMPDLK